MPPRDFASVLYRKALQDLFTVEKLLPDPASADEVIGFHAQQAVEKFMKAVLAKEGIVYRPTHNLAELVDLVEVSGFQAPADHGDFPALMPYAATLRYDDLDLEDQELLDRSRTLALVHRTREWARSLLGFEPER
ncbi:MAG: HEPN domain-containing protein [Candidatus Sericytochromatia bacterium]|nr:HEPN domain-containing protein [Candidatus Tanganyikabacteria bacterium]